MNNDNNKQMTEDNENTNGMHICMEIAAAESINGLNYTAPKANSN